MLVKSFFSPPLTFDSQARFCSNVGSASLATRKLVINANPFIHVSVDVLHGYGIIASTYRNWKLHSTVPSECAIIDNEYSKAWESCKQALSTFGFDSAEEDKILGKAFGQIHSPYWGEERKKEAPTLEAVSEILSYLKELGLTDEDISKLLKKFPEVLGCSLENELRTNVQILEKEWSIKGKTLRNLLLRNPRVLGYNIDCKGDCMAQCTRCWARF
ncbi:uncharacterized protein LOC127264469 [Andrographis paniculata]|uniref:uncharacterized protein LOC127264469 n=1 Tax=Andrographis paniculata TaxID=175694 RepID=UPI0021E8A784|nr:uncharacterized protein LOC127264469 [Andrographis paniculata]